MWEAIVGVIGIVVTLLGLWIKSKNEKRKRVDQAAKNESDAVRRERESEPAHRDGVINRNDASDLQRRNAESFTFGSKQELLFKVPRLKKEFEALPDALREVVYRFTHIANAMGVKPVVTCVSSHVEGSSGVHKAGRGIDIRDEYLGEFTYTKLERKILISTINRDFVYGNGYETCVWHSFENDPHHFHLQIPTSLTYNV